MTDQEISRALDGTFLGGLFDYISRWEAGKEHIEVRPRPELREIAEIFHAQGMRDAAVIAEGEMVELADDPTETPEDDVSYNMECIHIKTAILTAIPNHTVEDGEEGGEKRIYRQSEPECAGCVNMKGVGCTALPEELARRGICCHIPKTGSENTPKGGVCEWTYDGNEYAPKWDSACGEAWSFTEGGPEENRVKFCHGCGKPIKIKET